MLIVSSHGIFASSGNFSIFSSLSFQVRYMQKYTPFSAAYNSLILPVPELYESTLLFFPTVPFVSSGFQCIGVPHFIRRKSMGNLQSSTDLAEIDFLYCYIFIYAIFILLSWRYPLPKHYLNHFDNIR